MQRLRCFHFFFSPGSDAYTDEVTPTASAQTVWEMHVSANTYRSIRLPSLYPGVQW